MCRALEGKHSSTLSQHHTVVLLCRCWEMGLSSWGVSRRRCIATDKTKVAACSNHFALQAPCLWYLLTLFAGLNSSMRSFDANFSHL